MVRIVPSDPKSHDAKALIKRHLTQMAAQSPEDSCHAMDDSGLSASNVSFFLAWQGEQAVTMGAIAQLSDGVFELKSMHTLAEARGSGAGRAMLDHLLALAREKGGTELFLETGSTDDFLPARRLYEGYGFTPCGPFGDYVFDPWSVYMRLDLRQGS